MSEYFGTEETMRDTSDFEAGKVERLYTQGARYKYPAVELLCEEVESHYVDVLKGLIEQKNLLSESEGFYHLYLKVQDNPAMMIGFIRDTKLKILFTSRIFSAWGKFAMLSPETKVEGDMLLALCKI